MATAGEGQTGIPFLFRTAKKPNKINMKKQFELYGEFRDEARGIWDDYRSGLVPADQLMKRIDSFNERFLAAFPTGLPEYPEQEGPVPEAFSTEDTKAIAEGGELAPASTFAGDIAALQARADLIQPLLTELDRLRKERVGATKAWADYVAAGDAAELVAQLNRLEVGDITVTLRELPKEDGKDEETAILRALITSLDSQVRRLAIARDHVSRHYGERSAEAKELILQLTRMQDMLPELYKAVAKSRDNLAAEITDEDTTLNALIQSCLADYEHTDIGLLRSPPAGSATFPQTGTDQ